MPSGGRPAFAAERVVHSDGTVLILVSGAVNAVVSAEFMDVLIGGITPGKTLIVDVGSATHIDDTGMAALAVADRIAALQGGELQVHGCTDEAEHLFSTIRSGLVDTGPER